MPSHADADPPRYVRCDACDGEGSIPEHDGACDCWMIFPCHVCDGAGEVRAHLQEKERVANGSA